MNTIRPTTKQWNEFCNKYLSFDGETNINVDFQKITKVAGVPYFEFLRAMWVCTKDQYTVEEFCRINGGVPIKFFEKNVRDHEVTKLFEAGTKNTEL